MWRNRPLKCTHVCIITAHCIVEQHILEFVWHRLLLIILMVTMRQKMQLGIPTNFLLAKEGRLMQMR